MITWSHYEALREAVTKALKRLQGSEIRQVIYDDDFFASILEEPEVKEVKFNKTRTVLQVCPGEVAVAVALVIIEKKHACEPLTRKPGLWMIERYARVLDDQLRGAEKHYLRANQITLALLLSWGPPSIRRGLMRVKVPRPQAWRSAARVILRRMLFQVFHARINWLKQLGEYLESFGDQPPLEINGAVEKVTDDLIRGTCCHWWKGDPQGKTVDEIKNEIITSANSKRVALELAISDTERILAALETAVPAQVQGIFTTQLALCQRGVRESPNKQTTSAQYERRLLERRVKALEKGRRNHDPWNALKVELDDLRRQLEDGEYRSNDEDSCYSCSAQHRLDKWKPVPGAQAFEGPTYSNRERRKRPHNYDPGDLWNFVIRAVSGSASPLGCVFQKVSASEIRNQSVIFAEWEAQGQAFSSSMMFHALNSVQRHAILKSVGLVHRQCNDEACLRWVPSPELKRCNRGADCRLGQDWTTSIVLDRFIIVSDEPDNDSFKKMRAWACDGHKFQFRNFEGFEGDKAIYSIKRKEAKLVYAIRMKDLGCPYPNCTEPRSQRPVTAYVHRDVTFFAEAPAKNAAQVSYQAAGEVQCLEDLLNGNPDVRENLRRLIIYSEELRAELGSGQSKSPIIYELTNLLCDEPCRFWWLALDGGVPDWEAVLTTLLQRKRSEFVGWDAVKLRSAWLSEGRPAIDEFLGQE